MTPADSPGALMLVRFQDWTLLASYFPQHRAKGRFFSACKEIAAVHAAAPFVILGDLNTGNQLADKSPSGAPYACADGFDALRLEAGLVDLWRSSNGPDACEWTWLSSQKNGFASTTHSGMNLLSGCFNRHASTIIAHARKRLATIVH
jgi:hypothetical protein